MIPLLSGTKAMAFVVWEVLIQVGHLIHFYKQPNVESSILKAHFHLRCNAIFCCFESRIGYSHWPTIFVALVLAVAVV